MTKKNDTSQTTAQCAIHVVKPSFRPEIERGAADMISKYGKEKAYKNALSCKESYITDIETLQYYDGDKIKRWQDKAWEWHEIAQCIKNWA